MQNIPAPLVKTIMDASYWLSETCVTIYNVSSFTVD